MPKQRKQASHRARSLKSPRRTADVHPIGGGPADAPAEARCVRCFGPMPCAEHTRLMGTDSGVRKHFPLTTGLLDYFPDACCAVSEVSYQGNQKHNPGEPMHHARGKSMDHADCIGRHLLERGGFDGAIRHSAALAWRALALLQEELEREGLCTLPRGAKLP